MMTPEEQLKWLTDFSSFTSEKLPLLCALGDAWESSSIKEMERGLQLISAFGYCRDFIEKTLLFRDFSRRIERMKYYTERIKKEISMGQTVRGANGETLAYVLSLQPVSRRRGRPTKEEAAAAARSDSHSRIEEQKAALIAGIVGATVVVPTNLSPDAGKMAAASEKKEPEQPSSQADLFSQAVAVSQGEARLHFDQLEWLMSPALRQEVKRVRGLRATAANESNQAKALSERGVDSSIIEPHAQAAIKATNEYKGIYEMVDRELGRLCALLQAGADIPADIEKTMKQSGISKDSVIAALRPYWEKIGSPSVAEGNGSDAQEAENGSQGDDADKEPAESEEEGKPSKSARLHTIRTYMLRKDVKVTANRIEKMRACIEEVKEFGEDTTEYELILAKAVEELAESGSEETEKAE